MTRNPRPVREYSMRNRIAKAEAAQAAKRDHQFTFLRVPEDLCAKCGKTRKEHK